MKNKLIKTLIITAMSLIPTLSSTQEISSDFIFESKYLKIDGSNIHFIDQGKGDPILFLHGVPMSSYSWRNIIPHLVDSARCIAIDFIGFGKSDKPNIDYTFDQQYRYLSAFIDSLNLQNVTLVMTDIGGILGQKYARQNPENIKGLIFMETPLSDAKTLHKNGGMMQRMMFGMARKKKLGPYLFVKKNMFIKMMPKMIKRKLTKKEKEIYGNPFKTEVSRIPMFVLPHSYPKKGKNPATDDMADYLNKNAAWLSSSKHPKLLLTAKPGMMVNKKVIGWAKSNLKNLQTVHVGKAKHLMEEDLPHQIGQASRSWYLKIN